MNIYLIYHKLFDFDGKELTIGGIQTYLMNLAKVLLDNDMKPVIYQLANEPWTLNHNGIEIKGVQKLPLGGGIKQSRHLLNEILKVADYDSDIVIWGTDYISVKNKTIKSISIQHGVAFDFTLMYDKKQIILRKMGLDALYLFYQRYRSLRAFRNSKYNVCVDYNYLNWFRTMVPRSKINNKIEVIPNFTERSQLSSQYSSDNEEIKILFARRFVEQRGVYILFEIIDHFLKRNSNVSFTIAGEGPLKSDIFKKYQNNKNITITSYAHDESLLIHSKHHIAIVPTWGGEGTSLSLLEAMTSGCVPIATNVGGMTNIILDGFNGFLVNPIACEFIEKIQFLLSNYETSKEMSINSKKSVDQAFSYDKWKSSWLKLIYKLNSNNHEDENVYI